MSRQYPTAMFRKVDYYVDVKLVEDDDDEDNAEVDATQRPAHKKLFNCTWVCASVAGSVGVCVPRISTVKWVQQRASQPGS